MEEKFINKVAESGIITIDPASFLPDESNMLELDLKDFLFMELILKEKDFRDKLKNTDWELFRSKNVAVFCSADAIIPMWAYMLISTYLQPVAGYYTFGDKEQLYRELIQQNIETLPAATYEGSRLVIKGCGDTPVPDFIYLSLTRHLLSTARSIMFGEPCSTVPVYKKKSAAIS